MRGPSTSIHRRIASWIAAAVGLALFIYSVRQVGFARIAVDIRNVGAGFLLILLLAGVRDIVRTWSWTLCVDPEYRLPFRHALSARFMGEALGNLTPLGLLVSEPAKAVLVRDRLPLMTAFSALAIEQLFYSLSVVIVIAAGMAAMLASVTLSPSLRILGIGTIGMVIAMAGGAIALIKSRPPVAARVLALLAWAGVPEGVLSGVGHPALALETRLYASYDRAQTRIGAIGFLILIFHAAAIFEVYVALALITGRAPSLFDTFVLESVNRLITVAFKFVPLRLGVDEAGSGLATRILQLGSAAGVTLAIVRKARVLTFSAIGVVLLARRGLTMRGLLEEGQRAASGAKARG